MANTSRVVQAEKGYVDGEHAARLTDAGRRMFIQHEGGKTLRSTGVARATLYPYCKAIICNLQRSRQLKETRVDAL